MIRILCLWSPMVVCFAWAVVALAELDNRTTTTIGRISLGLSLFLHISAEARRD